MVWLADVERISKAVIRIHHNGQFGRVANRRGVLCDIAQTYESHIRHREESVGQAGTGKVDRLEAQIFGYACGECIGCAGHQHRAAGQNAVFESAVDFVVHHWA